ncbi:MAG: F0F1 ATP synthase subunit B [Candidatus Humimicrobiaceae bacterium]
MEELSKILNPMTSTIFWSIVCFLILFFVLWKFVFKPVGKMINSRQEEITKNLNEAERQRDEAIKYLDEQKMMLEESKKEAREIIESGRQTAHKAHEEIVEASHEKSRQMLDSALEEIKREKERSLSEVKNRIIDIAMQTTEKVISKNLSEEEHKKLIEESLKEVGKAVE